MAVGGGVTRQRTHNDWWCGFPSALHKIDHALVQLGGRYAGGQGEIQRIDLASAPQLQEAPQRCFGFATASFSLQHHDRPQAAIGHGRLHGAGRRHAKGLRKVGMGVLLARGGIAHF